MFHFILGTGKTLSLLCAALAWRETFIARLQLNSNVVKKEGCQFVKETQETLDLTAGYGISETSKAVPKIIYASRTHSQLSQAINELKNTIYKPKICVLGSRDQLCINHDVMKLEGSAAKVYACKAKISSRSCRFFNNLEANKSNTNFKKEILDIEDLGKLGSEHGVCPYFMSKEMKTNADLIFMPYNYVLDFKSRQAHSIDLSNTIVLLDEAHNVEKICEDSASFELRAFDLACAQQDLNKCIDILRNGDALDIEGEDEKTMAGPCLTPEDAAHLKKVFKNIEDVIRAAPLDKLDRFDADANFLFDALDKENINATTVTPILEAIDRCNTLLATKVSKADAGQVVSLQKISDVFKIMFCRSGGPVNFNFETARFYKAFIKKDPLTAAQKAKLCGWNSNSGDKKKDYEPRSLSYWCFHAGITMRDIIRQGVRSLILTSGTLSPLDSFTSELDVSFPVQLQNPHVITSKQIWAGIITKGPDGVELKSSYDNRDNPKYKRSMGNLLLNLSRVTPSGLLVFFPSYPVMDKCIQSWHSENILARITQNKPHFVEPKNKKELNTQMEMFYEKIKDPAFKGATFFAVCRGKVSEGLDFADDNGRVVVITGLPFPPMTDPKVELKKQFLDGPHNKGLLRGRQWYRQQASRAVNQAVGRVIRHNKDYGAILLCDVRFTYPDAIDQLPIWIKPYVKVYEEYGTVQRSLVLFFKTVENMFSPPAKKKTVEERGANSKEVGHSTVESRHDVTRRRVDRRLADSYQAEGRVKYNSDAANSLAVLKSEEGPENKVGLFESLATSNQRKARDVTNSSKSMSDAILDSKNETNSDADVKMKSRKFKIVTRKTEPKMDDNENKEEAAKPKSEATKQERTAAAKVYIGKIKDILSSEDYKKFGKILTTYKKSNDVKYLTENLVKFVSDKLEHVHLFQGVGTFIKKDNEKELFETAFQRLMTQTEKESAGKEPASKKRKVSSTEGRTGKKSDTTHNPHSDFFPTLSDDDDDDDDATSAQSGDFDDISNPKCISCTKRVISPYKAPCGHIACFECWAKHFKIAKCCPKCKIGLRLRKLQKIYMS